MAQGDGSREEGAEDEHEGSEKREDRGAGVSQSGREPTVHTAFLRNASECAQTPRIA